jgi:hypothetical protein
MSDFLQFIVVIAGINPKPIEENLGKCIIPSPGKLNIVNNQKITGNKFS